MCEWPRLRLTGVMRLCLLSVEAVMLIVTREPIVVV